jgi:predicted DNA-binding protein
VRAVRQERAEVMNAQPKRVTVHLEPEMHEALLRKAAETGRTVSDFVNDAVRASLIEDLEDLAAFVERAKEPSIPFERVVRDLKRRAKVQ